MKILISAYSIEPNQGSEHEIGWSWVKELSKNQNFQITIITRKSNKKKIYQENNLIKKKNINFWFYDAPSFFLRIFKKKNKKNTYFYFYIWQLLIFLKYKKKIYQNKFNFIHHVTFSSLRIPSFLFLCKSNFFFGPVSGGETVPNLLANNFSFKGKIIEKLRKISNFLIKYSPVMNLLFFFSKKIILTDKISLSLIPQKFHNKIIIIPSIFNKKIFFKNKKKNTYNIFFSGRLIEWKGVNYLIKIYENVIKFNKKIKLNIYGNGPLKSKILNEIKNKKLNNCINVCNHLTQKKFLKQIKKNDLLIFPTLRDSGGYVLIEALNQKINILTTNAPGPNSIIKKNELGYVNIYDRSENDVINDFSKKIINYYKSKKIFYETELHRNIKPINKINKIYEQ